MTSPPNPPPLQTTSSQVQPTSSPLQIKEYTAFLQLRFFLAMGWHMQALIVQWYVYTLTHDPFMMGLIGLAEALPAIGAALPMGSLVDRMDKRVAVRFAGGVILLSAIATACLVQPWALPYLGKGSLLTGLFAMIILNGLARAMYSPAMFTMLGMIVPRDLIPKASAMSSSVWQAAVIAGPLVGGLMYGWLGVGVTSITYVACMMLGLSGVWRLSPKPAFVVEVRQRVYDELMQGVRFIVSKKVLLGALTLDLFAVLFGGVVALLPVYAHKILHVDQTGLGVLRAAMSIGSVAMMAWLSVRPPKANAGRTLLWSVGAFGVCMLAFSYSEIFWLSVAILVVAGVFDSVSVVIRHTILQLETPESMKGRVAAANTMFITSSNEIGAFESGLAARLIGVQPSVVFGGLMTLLVVGVVAYTMPALRKLKLQ